MRNLLAVSIGLAILGVFCLPAYGVTTFDTDTVWHVMQVPKIASGFAYHSRPWATWLLTSFHVVDGSGRILVWRDNLQQIFTAQLVAGNSEWDFAVLKVNIGKQPCLSLGTDVETGDPICTFGHVTDTAGLYLTGSKIGTIMDNYSLSSWQLGKGGSGSPVVDMRTGRVAGIIGGVVVAERLQPASVYIPVGRVLAWLERERLL